MHLGGVQGTGVLRCMAQTRILFGGKEAGGEWRLVGHMEVCSVVADVHYL